MPHDRYRLNLDGSSLTPVVDVVRRAQDHFSEMLAALSDAGGLNREHYVRYLSFQYHLTRGVQRSFLAVAANPVMTDRRPLREFLFNFALEEEPHFSIAAKDLEHLGLSPLPCPLDVKLWWAYFTGVVNDAPFVRLGATCVLENLGAGSATEAKRLLASAPFITSDNSRFIQIHFHEALPHGDQIYHALASVPLSEAELRQLTNGAAEGAIMYLRMAAWALGADPLQMMFDDILV